MLISGCSSPPPPEPVEWDKETQATNTALPSWQANDLIIPSPVVTGSWFKTLYSFTGDEGSYGIDVYYAVPHSHRIVVSASRTSDYFAAKTWLRQHGAKGVIEYQHKLAGFGFYQTDLFFYR